MDVELALLQDVLDNPGDDTPLLVLADWLMEQDSPLRQARGEFIRVQVLLAQGASGAERAHLKRRERLLQEKFEELWMAGLKVEDWSFFRGLVGLWLEASSIDDIEELVSRGEWAYVNELHLDLSGAQRADHEAARLLESPHVERLAVLDLSGNGLTDALADSLAKARLGRLRRLDLSRNGLSTRSAEALLRSPHLDGLESLSVWENAISPEWRQRLSERFGKVAG